MNTFFCNSCFISTTISIASDFYLTNCSHIFCAKCVTSLNQTCGICCQPCKFLNIKNAPPHLKVIFEDPIKKADTLQDILRFQTEQQKLFVEKNKSIPDNYKQCKKDIIVLKNQYEDILTCIKNEKKLINQLKNSSDRYNYVSESPNVPNLMPILRTSQGSHNNLTPGSARASSSDCRTMNSSNENFSFEVPNSKKRLGMTNSAVSAPNLASTSPIPTNTNITPLSQLSRISQQVLSNINNSYSPYSQSHQRLNQQRNTASDPISRARYNPFPNFK